MEQPFAVVTGASSGLGAEFARSLAKRKFNLVLVARRAEPMEALAVELCRQYQVQVIVEPLDLGVVDSANALKKLLDDRGVSPDILINNAAFGHHGQFLDMDLFRIRDLVQLDILSTVELTHVFGRAMRDRGRGNILIVASLAAYQPTPIMTIYGAAKSFILSFGEALNVELAPKVGVTVISPGLMATEFNQVAGFNPGASAKVSMLPPGVVAEMGIEAMFSHKSSRVAGKLNTLSVFFMRFLSRHVMAKIAYRMSTE